MRLKLNRIGEPFVLRTSSENGGSILFDASEDIGGTSKGVRPMQALASSLAACSSIDVLNILKKQRENVTEYEVDILANRTDAIPSVFDTIHLIFKLKGVSQESAERAVSLSMNKYCSVTKMLEKSCEITYSVSLIK